MSFLIDDILKQNTNNNTTSDCCSIKSPPPSQLHPSQNFSLLEWTLSNNKHCCISNTAQEFTRIYNNQISSPTANFSMPVSNFASRNYFWPHCLPYHQMTISSCSYNNHVKRKGGQIRFTASQTEELERQFSSHKYLSPDNRKQLAEILRLSDRQVKTWFQNRRAKWRRCKHICNTNDDNSEIVNDFSSLSNTVINLQTDESTE